MQSQPNESVIRYIRWLIWAYFWLLILEGALRKWIVPAWSDPLLIIRDPVVIAIYLLAIKARVFPRNAFVYSLIAIAGLSWVVGLLVLQPYLPVKPLLFVTLFGVRSNFLHLPLIWVMAKVFDAEEVKRVGWWILFVMLPLALLMAVQFKSSEDSFINRTAGTGEGVQITAGGGKIRPPATFSFISGMIFYTALSAAFLVYGALSRGVYRNWLLFAAGLAVAVATAVSGSRSVLLAVLVVGAATAVIFALRPSAMNQFGRNLIIVCAVGFLVSRLPIVNEGIDILSDRFTASAEAGEHSVTGDVTTRVLSGFEEGFYVVTKAPLFGYGIGVGTNAGAKFLTGHSMFLLSEGEWTRVVLESGPLFGLAFVIWRIVLMCWLGYICLTEVRRGQILPLLLYSACFLAILNGQFGQPTNLGFAVFIGGLCLAATNREYYKPIEAPLQHSEAPPPEPRLPRRSPFAERLHQTTSATDQSNGSVDR